MRRAGLLVLGLLLVGADLAQAANRRVALLLDTSGSMLSTDRPRYTVQLTQIIADLLDPSDELTVVRLGGGILCWDGPSSSLALRLDPGDRAGFRRRLDQMISYSGDNTFAAPVRTAIQALTLDPSKRRMLLMIADSGGLGFCDGPLTRELQKLHSSGAIIAAINLGSSAGAFDSNPAFDFTTAAQNPEELVSAVGQVYQRFLGNRRVQSGSVRGQIELEMDVSVRDAFLIVAADGPISPLEQGAGNPRAVGLDLNYRGGGQTEGLDGRVRGYRIVHFQRPGSGRWTFRAPGLAADAAWILLQEDTLGARVISPGVVAEGAETLMKAEFYDTETGKSVREISKIPGTTMSMDVDGRTLTLRDDGTGGDEKAGDGIFSAPHTFKGRGKRDVPLRMQTHNIDRTVQVGLEVVEAGWQVIPPRLDKVELDKPVPLAVEIQPVGQPSAPRTPPEKIEVRVGGAPQAELRDEGKDGAPKDGRYEGTWTPTALGPQELELKPVGGSMAAPVTARVEVVGKLDLGKAVPVRFGPLRGDSQGEAALDLSQAEAKGSFDLEVSSPFTSSGAQLEIDTGSGWVPVGAKPVVIRLENGGPRSWPLRLRVGSCPAACAPTELHQLVVSAHGPDGQPRRLDVPLHVEVIPDPWLQCWWPLLAALVGAGLFGFVAYGFWSPSRFAPRLGVVLSQERNLDQEGFFHAVRAVRGSGSGFYRDAMVYINQDFSLTGRPTNALARLRAHKTQVRIRPMPGATVWRQNLDGQWDQLASDTETTVRSSVTYRNDASSLFFEVRNR